MLLRLAHIPVLLLWFQVVSAQATKYNLKGFSAANTITKDVVIIGGGASGTFAAISIKDKGKSVVVVEIKDRLGGHTETYTDPKTRRAIDYGVIIWHNISVVTNFFNRLKVPVVLQGADGIINGQQTYEMVFDLKTGRALEDPRPNQTAVGLALQRYTQQLLKYPGLDAGMFLPDPVPDDLVMPFGQFAKKYGIEAAIPTMYQFNAGVGNILTVPTVENMRTWGLSLVQSLQGGFITTARHNNSELYGKAQTELNRSKSLLLKSKIMYTERSTAGVQLVVSTPSGDKLIKAKRLLITIPPKLDYLKPFNLTTQETQIFRNLSNTGYYTSIVQNTSLPDDLSVVHFSGNTLSNIPTLPAIYSIGSSIYTPGLKTIYYGTPLTSNTTSLSDTTVKNAIVTSIKKMQTANPNAFNKTTPSFVRFSSHAPFYLQANSADIKRGFYKKMYALQGNKNTFWTGATWRAQDSSDIWKFTEEQVLPKLLKGL